MDIKQKALVKAVGDGELTVLVKSVVDKLLKKAEQDLSAVVSDKIRNSLGVVGETFKKNLLNSARIWEQHNTTPMPILPDGVKYYMSAADLTRVVIEYKPQVRNLLFSRTYLSSSAKGLRDRRAASSLCDQKPVAVSLALPYVVFVLHFYEKFKWLNDEQMKFAMMYTFYRNKPLQSLKDEVYQVNFPNVNSSGSIVCLGGHGNRLAEDMMGKSLSHQIEAIMSFFWQSMFNVDYVDTFCDMAELEPKLSSINAWAEASAEDPSFPLRVNWKRLGHLKDFIGDNTRPDNGLSRDIQLKTEEAIGKCVKEVRSSFKNYNVVIPNDAATGRIIAEKIEELVVIAAEKAVADLERDLKAERFMLEKERLRLVQGIKKEVFDFDPTDVW